MKTVPRAISTKLSRLRIKVSYQSRRFLIQSPVFDTITIFSHAVLREDKNNVKAIQYKVVCLIKLRHIDEALQVIENADSNVQ